MAFPLLDLPLDAGIGHRETAQRRRHMAESDGFELSLRNATSADPGGLVLRAPAWFCAEAFRRRHVCHRTGGSISISCNAQSAQNRCSDNDRISATDCLYRQLYIL